MPEEHNIPVVQIERKISLINNLVEGDLKNRLKEDFGVVVSGVDISAIEVDKDSDGYRQLKLVTQDVTAKTVQTQTSNFATYQVEAQTEVGVAGANALGQMGANNTGGMSDGGFNPVAMMADMAIGGAMGQNIAGTMNNIMQGNSQPMQNIVTPPPVPQSLYHVAVNGQATGPYDVATLKQMILAGQINASTYVWTACMSDWMELGKVETLKGI